jgi:nucleotide-binding universal stress UspA family protein
MSLSAAMPVTALKLSRILAPVDFTAPCRRAAQHAEALARRFGAEVVLLHAVNAVSLPFGPAEALAYTGGADLARQQVAEMTPVLEEFLTKEFQGISTTRVLIEGDPAHVIFDFARERRCDLIVMPTHGYGVLHRLLAGSTTVEVLRHAPCPVWTGCHFDEAPPPGQCRSVVCAVGWTSHDAEAEAWAASLAAAYDARLLVVDAPSAYAGPEYLSARAKAAEAEVLVIGRGPRAYSIVRAAPCTVVAV